VIPALDALVEGGILLAVISNWSWQAPELIHDLELARHFETLVISSRIGFQKPHPGIFEHALQRVGVTPDRAVHVGDSYKADVMGARRVGIDAVLIDRYSEDPARVREERGDPDLAVVRDLFELLDLLGIARPTAPVATTPA
jgi:putative hydrolase of the HAD superfamily